MPLDFAATLLPELPGLAVVGALPDGAGGGHLAGIEIAVATVLFPPGPGVVAEIAQDDPDRFVMFAADVVERLDRDRALPALIRLPAQRAPCGDVVPAPASAVRVAVAVAGVGAVAGTVGAVVVADLPLRRPGHPEGEGEIPALIGRRAVGGDRARRGRADQEEGRQRGTQSGQERRFHQGILRGDRRVPGTVTQKGGGVSTLWTCSHPLRRGPLTGWSRRQTGQAVP